MHTFIGRTPKISLGVVPMLCALACCQARAGDLEESECKNPLKDISCYLADLGEGQVSAASIVGVTPTAIQNVQSSQDIIVAVKPFSSSDSKSGFGIAITPARTSITPMSGRLYNSSNFYRLIGLLTFSYAESNANIEPSSYVKRGGSIDTMFYLNKESDPIIRAYNTWISCKGEKIAHDKMVAAIGKPEYEQALKDWKQAAAQCFEVDAKTPWNASRISISLGHGTISAAGGASYSLGTSAAITGIFATSKNTALQIIYRKTINEIIINTLATGPAYRSSSLGAVRFTAARDVANRLQALLEVSTAKGRSSIQSDAVFKYAVGIDLRIHPGVWVEFRYGRGRTITNTSLENRGMVSLNLSPTCALFKRCDAG